MVKNKFGGNRHKKMASKDVKMVHTRKTRYIKEDGEMYARVTKMSGGGHAVIDCDDGVERTLVIRNKFKKRNKRDNTLSEGTYVLAGIRLWEVIAPKKKQKADLLYVYGKSEVEDIKKKCKILFSTINEDNEDVSIEFVNNDTEIEDIKLPANNNTTKKLNLKTEKGDDISWDDI